MIKLLHKVDFKRFFIIYILLLISSIAYPQQYKISDESFVTYEVTAGVFGFIPNKIIGKNRKIKGVIQTEPRVAVQLTIPVRSFRSGNTTRDENIAEILKYKEFPEISFRLLSVNDATFKQVLERGSRKFTMQGELTVAGKTKQYEFFVITEKETDSKIKFKTQVEAKFTDFGIKPPTLWGFVKTSPDRLLLKGEIIVDMK